MYAYYYNLQPQCLFIQPIATIFLIFRFSNGVGFSASVQPSFIPLSGIDYIDQTTSQCSIINYPLKFQDII